MSTTSELIKTTGKEHITNIIKAGIQTIPYIGGPLGSLLSDYLPNYKTERLIKFIENLSSDIENLKDIKIDEKYLVSEEFGYLFEKTLKSVNIEYRKEKLEIYKNLLLNFSIKTDINADEKEYILSIIDGLEVIHIIVLSAFIKPQQVNQQSGFGGSYNDTLGRIFREKGIENILWTSALKDLENKGIIKPTFSNLHTMLSREPTLENQMTELGNKIKNLIIL